MEVAEQRELPPGTMLDDKYRIDGLLAVGGMGAVYVGTHIKLRKRVAVKVLNPQLANPQMIERFHREAITASQIGHEGIAQVTDLGTSTLGESFLVMELLEGESLAKRLKATGALPIEVAAELGCAILSPLEAAHRAGVVHRDLKPDNVFLVRQSRGEVVKLLDFGISRASGLEAEFRLTTTGLVLGTPYYMSPEQARGDSSITLAADLYAFGVILYEMLCGRVPITGENYNQLMYRVMTGEYQPPHELRPDLPPPLERLIMRSMALEAGARPRSASEIEHELLAFCRPTFREHTVERMSAAGFSPSLTPAPMYNTQPRPAGRRGLIIAVTAVVLVGGGIAAAVIAGGGGGGSGATPVAGTAPGSTTAGPTAPVSTTSSGSPTPTTTASGTTASGTTASGTTASGTTASGTTTASGAPTAPMSPTITLRFAITPADATVEIDGAKVAGGELVVKQDASTHKVHIAAAGYLPHDEAIKFDEAQRLTITLPKATGKPGKGNTKGKHGDKIESQSPYD